MLIKYNKEADRLLLVLSSSRGPTFTYEATDVSVLVDEGDTLVDIEIENASAFIAKALAAGVEVEGAPEVAPLKSEMVWEDVDSSMISAFGYNEAEGILEVAFNRTGVYRYFDVPADVVEGLREASSKGRYMRSMIIDMYRYEQ